MGKTIHLVVLLHGINGTSSELDYVKEQLIKQFDSDDVVFENPTINEGFTNDGCMKGAKRVYDWIMKKQEEMNIAYISFVCHSLGGIYARALIGMLYRDEIIPGRMMPINYITLATPHLGARQHAHLGDTITGMVVKVVCGPTVTELTLNDHPTKDGCLFSNLSDKHHIDSLGTFRNLIVYSNVNNDITVNYLTGAIRREHMDEDKGAKVVHDDRLEVVKCKKVRIEDKLYTALNVLPWKRFAVYPKRMLFAHTDMVTKKYGHHVVDHLLTQFYHPDKQ
ncbi:hypothetical protein HDV06_004304 [Boothiomyces sp. JEL0866]|nr:hypothetical protein HDV06_004304 [Boothiomyces sp. JEL0866]